MVLRVSFEVMVMSQNCHRSAIRSWVGWPLTWRCYQLSISGRIWTSPTSGELGERICTLIFVWRLGQSEFDIKWDHKAVIDGRN